MELELIEHKGNKIALLTSGEVLIHETQDALDLNFQLAIIGDFAKYKSKSLRDFIFESNKHGRINFVSSIEEAKERLTK